MFEWHCWSPFTEVNCVKPCLPPPPDRALEAKPCLTLSARPDLPLQQQAMPCLPSPAVLSEPRPNRPCLPNHAGPRRTVPCPSTAQRRLPCRAQPRHLLLRPALPAKPPSTMHALTSSPDTAEPSLPQRCHFMTEQALPAKRNPARPNRDLPCLPHLAAPRRAAPRPDHASPCLPDLDIQTQQRLAFAGLPKLAGPPTPCPPLTRLPKRTGPHTIAHRLAQHRLPRRARPNHPCRTETSLPNRAVPYCTLHAQSRPACRAEPPTPTPPPCLACHAL